jgi:hypothetical protein
LRLGGGVHLQLSAGSDLVLGDSDAVELLAGTLHVDTGERAPRRRGPALTVTTGAGVVRDVGTRFSVRLFGGRDAALRVRVVTGVVTVEQRRRSWRAGAGQELTVSLDGRAERRELAATETKWPPEDSLSFSLEGSSVAHLLRWIAVETGWRIAYEDPEAERIAAEALVRGELAGLRPEQAAFALLPGAGLEAELAGGVLRVRRQAAGRPLTAPR